MKRYTIILKNSGQHEGCYNVDKKLYEQIKKNIKPYRGMISKAKSVKCIETGKVFKSAAHAQSWVYNQGLSTSMNFTAIKNACKGLKETMYGYQWEYSD